MASSKLIKKLYTDVTRLKLLEKDGAEPRFRIKGTPFTGEESDDELASRKPQDYVVTGLIFPKSEIFCERAYEIEMKLTKTFPADPPEVRFLTPIYHPNVAKDGKFCNALLQKNQKWTPDKTLNDVIKAVVEHIDKPDIDYSLSVELGKQYQENRDEFNRLASEYVRKHGLPRQ